MSKIKTLDRKSSGLNFVRANNWTDLDMASHKEIMEQIWVSFSVTLNITVCKKWLYRTNVIYKYCYTSLACNYIIVYIYTLLCYGDHAQRLSFLNQVLLQMWLSLSNNINLPEHTIMTAWNVMAFLTEPNVSENMVGPSKQNQKFKQIWVALLSKVKCLSNMTGLYKQNQVFQQLRLA